MENSQLRTLITSIRGWLDAMSNMLALENGEVISPQLRRIFQTLQGNLAENQERIKKEVEDYYTKHPPFEWNRKKKKRKNERIAQDWLQHSNLVIIAMLLKSKEHLLKWGVKYPLDSDGPGLAEIPSKYIDALEEQKDEVFKTEESKEYYGYLVKEIRKHTNYR